METPSFGDFCGNDDMNEFLSNLVGTLHPAQNENMKNLDGNLSQIESLVTLVCEAVEESQARNSLPSWAKDLRIALRGILQDRNTQIAQKSKCLRTSSRCLEIFGWKFLSSDPQFLCLLTELSSVEIRLLLDQPTESVGESGLSTLVCSCSLVEKSMLIVEEENIEDSFATVISGSCQALISFLLDFFVKAKNEQDIKISEAVGCPLFRLICCFLARGGHEILDRNLLKEALPILHKYACEASVENFDANQLLAPAVEILPSDIVPRNLKSNFADKE